MSVAPKHLVRLATLAAVMTVCVLVTRANGASSFVLVHLFYFPIILAAFWYREVGGALGGALAGVATGPLLLADATPSEYAALSSESLAQRPPVSRMANTTPTGSARCRNQGSR